MSDSTHPSRASASPSLDHDDIRRSVPNALTLARILLSVAFFAVLLGYHWEPADAGVRWRLIFAAVIISLAAVTDALDGHLARKWKAVSIFGRIMDPFADKFLVLGALAFLAAPGFYWIDGDWLTVLDGSGGWAGGGAGGWGGSSGGGGRGVFVSGVHPWMVVAILGRELLVTSIRGVLEAQGVAFPATWSGKAKMILQSAAVPIVLFLLALPIHVLDGGRGSASWGFWVIQSLVRVTVLVTLWSGVPYVSKAVAVTRHKGGLGEGKVGRNVERVIGED
jgi:CDP-diacylglycerol--glycerol-3-phosphate 3-phosphatidyltransferase